MSYDELLLLQPEHPFCPCPRPYRRQLEEDTDDGETWEIVYTCLVLFLMFVALVSDRVGADSVMLAALTLFMAAEIITISEGLEGFANEGLLTVLVLFVVAEGISRTGALDWYMGKLLGRPKSVASAQLRLMVPIAIVSAFLNNTPVVAVMIPIVQRWGKNVGISPQQLLIPLSFSSILGGTCTLIGTSTNLVVVGLLNERYPDDPSINIELFSLGEYGVPIAIAGITYILVASPFLCPGGTRSKDNQGTAPVEFGDDILLGARVTQWSPSAGRTVKRSGLRDTGGIFLVSVHRAMTGNIHRAVGQDFVLNEGDILYFTGLVESFGEFCEDHGLEVVTNELERTMLKEGAAVEEKKSIAGSSDDGNESNNSAFPSRTGKPLPTLLEHCEGGVPCEIGLTKESLVQAGGADVLRSINQMQDHIRGRSERMDDTQKGKKVSFASAGLLGPADPHKIVVTVDHHLVVVGIDARDRPGLLLDISKGLLRLNLQLHHTEAAVVEFRSISIWRCEVMNTDIPDVEQIWSVLNALLETETGVEAVKKRGLRVIRARVTKFSCLIDNTATGVDFRKRYKAAIVAVQKGGRNSNQLLSTIKFDEDDILVLQTSDDSPLLKRPPDDFYSKVAAEAAKEKNPSRTNSVKSLVDLVTGRRSRNNSTNDLQSLENKRSDSDLPHLCAETDVDSRRQVGNARSGSDDDFFIPSDDDFDNVEAGETIEVPETETVDESMVWRDLEVIFVDDNTGGGDSSREFLTAMAIAPNSRFANQTVSQAGINKLAGVFLVGIERPLELPSDRSRKSKTTRRTASDGGASTEDIGSSLRSAESMFITISPEEPLSEGDVLWFSGSASAIGDLRKIPGLVSYQSDEVEKINEKVHDRRLVQAVIARKGPLVGKTVKEVRFRTRYGAAVIAVHREGKRVHDHPGKIKLQAGDVLLLEAGPTFIGRTADNERSFALLAEVQDSAPPRLSLLIPALIIAAAMLIVFTAGVASLLVCALVASVLMVSLGILSEQEARDAVNWEVYITIASAFGIGTALVNSGVAGAIANFLVDVGNGINIGDAGLLGAVYFATFLISNVVTNNAAAALLFPIALDAAEQTGIDRVLMSYCLMLGASASFMSPFGYTTNLLIYGPGGYKYNDFLVMGTPMQIVLWVLSVLFLSMTSFWWLSWIVTSAALVVVVALRVCNVKASDLTILSKRKRPEDANR